MQEVAPPVQMFTQEQMEAILRQALAATPAKKKQTAGKGAPRRGDKKALAKKKKTAAAGHV